jgi:hypothetical protein
MGEPSDKRRAARRPGKRERARVKKPRRGWHSLSGPHVVNVLGVGTVRVVAGQKKRTRILRWLDFASQVEERRPSSLGNLEPERTGERGTAELLSVLGSRHRSRPQS